MSISDQLQSLAQRVGDGFHHVLQDAQQAWFQPTEQDFAEAGNLQQQRPQTSTPKAPAGDVAMAKVDMPGTADEQLARANAQKVLDQIDWSKPNITLWVPATGSHDAPQQWTDAVSKAFDPASTSSATIDYPADTNFPDSVSTGIATTQLILAGIAQHGGDHNVTVGGHSQGAWVLGEVLSNPTIASTVDRAVLFGHPGTAAHSFAGSTDGKVVEVDDPHDPFTWPVEGRDDALKATAELHSGGQVASGIDDLAKSVVDNPKLAAYLVGRTVFQQDYKGEADPHHYENLYGDAATWLATGTNSQAA